MTAKATIIPAFELSQYVPEEVNSDFKFLFDLMGNF